MENLFHKYMLVSYEAFQRKALAVYHACSETTNFMYSPSNFETHEYLVAAGMT